MRKSCTLLWLLFLAPLFAYASLPPSPPDLALLPTGGGEVWVLRGLMAGDPVSTDLLQPSSETGMIRGVGLSPDGDTGIVLHQSRGRLLGSVATLDSAGLSVYRGLLGPGPYEETVLRLEDGVEIPYMVSFLPCGKAALILNFEPEVGWPLSVQVLEGLPGEPHLSSEVPLFRGDGSRALGYSELSLSVAPDCRHAAVVAPEASVILLGIAQGPPFSIRQQDAVELEGYQGSGRPGHSTWWASFGPDGDTFLTPMWKPVPFTGAEVPARLYLFSEILQNRLHLAWEETLPDTADDWLGVGVFPEGDRFAASSFQPVPGNQIHFFEGLRARTPRRTGSVRWEVEPGGAALYLLPDGDTMLAPNWRMRYTTYHAVFKGAATSQASLVGSVGPVSGGFPPAVPAFLPRTIPDGGEDQVLAANDECRATAHLSGAARFDAACAPQPDERVLGFSWWEGATLLAEERESDVVLGLGLHELTFRVVDTSRRVYEDTMAVEVVDVTPPAFERLEAEPSVLWPPNHKLRPVRVRLEVHDNCDASPQVSLLAVLSSEPPDDRGDGDTEADIFEVDLGTDDRAFLLRAERDGRGPGRTYRSTYSATDFSGNSAEGSAMVRVPHDQGGGSD